MTIQYIFRNKKTGNIIATIDEAWMPVSSDLMDLVDQGKLTVEEFDEAAEEAAAAEAAAESAAENAWLTAAEAGTPDTWADEDAARGVCFF